MSSECLLAELGQPNDCGCLHLWYSSTVQTYTVYGIHVAQSVSQSGSHHIGQHGYSGTDFDGALKLLHLKEYYSHGEHLTIDGFERFTKDLTDGMILHLSLDDESGLEADMTLKGSDNGTVTGSLLPEDPQPTWQPSDALIQTRPDYSPDDHSQSLKKDALAVCDGYFYEDPLHSLCQDL